MYQKKSQKTTKKVNEYVKEIRNDKNSHDTNDIFRLFNGLWMCST